jgi:hypothetical protein
MFALLSCSSGGTTDPTKTTPTVANVNLDQTSVSVTVGQTTQLSATVTDANGNTLNNSVKWTSSASNVATVSSSGMVAGVAPGNATITASSGGQSATASVTVTPAMVTIVVNNQLVGPIQVYANGTPLGTVNAQSSGQAQIQPNGSISVSWQLIKPTTTSGVPVGEDMGGTFQPVVNPGSTLNYTVNNLIGSQYYFAPLVSNFGSSRLLMAVNFGLVAESRCNCVVAPGQTDVYIGYYRLYSNSNVFAFDDGSNYTGGYVYWQNFASLVAQNSGVLRINTNLSPTYIVAGAPPLRPTSASLSLHSPVSASR